MQLTDPEAAPHSPRGSQKKGCFGLLHLEKMTKEDAFFFVVTGEDARGISRVPPCLAASLRRPQPTGFRAAEKKNLMPRGIKLQVAPSAPR